MPNLIANQNVVAVHWIIVAATLSLLSLHSIFIRSSFDLGVYVYVVHCLCTFCRSLYSSIIPFHDCRLPKCHLLIFCDRFTIRLSGQTHSFDYSLFSFVFSFVLTFVRFRFTFFVSFTSQLPPFRTFRRLLLVSFDQKRLWVDDFDRRRSAHF